MSIRRINPCRKVSKVPLLNPPKFTECLAIDRWGSYNLLYNCDSHCEGLFILTNMVKKGRFKVIERSVVTLSPAAQAQVQKIVESEPPPEGFGLRFDVVNGGCSGFNYKMDFDRAQSEDFQYNLGYVNLLVSPGAQPFLQGMVVDFKGGLHGKGFSFHNPNAMNTCSCGDSFNV